MSAQPPTALLVLDAQRCCHQALEDQDPRAAEARLAPWREQVSAARACGEVVVFLQQDGPPGSECEPLTRGWTLHPDFRVEDQDLLLRVSSADAFLHSPLTLELHARGIRQVRLLGLAGSAAVHATTQGAQQAGLSVAEAARDHA